MATATINLYYVLRRTMNEQDARVAEAAIVETARREAIAVQKGGAKKELPPLVEATFATEIKHLATREGLAWLEGRINLMATRDGVANMEKRLVYWVAGAIISVLISAIALLSVIKTSPAQHLQPTASEVQK